jgi:hypothetical protein
MKDIFGIIPLLLVGGVAWLLFYGGANGASALSPLDWTIALLTLVWLVAIVTVPWNIYFQARAVLAEAGESRKREIHIDEEKIAYTKRWSDRALLIAVLLHVATAIGMYFLASAGVSFIGYFGAGAALALTVVRPITRLYAYVRQRLVTIGEEIAYPRHDVVSLKFTVENLTARVKALEEKLDADNEYSWAAERARAETVQQDKLDFLRHRLDSLEETNKLAHEQISRDAQNVTAKAMADVAIVSHVREIIRFFKDA